MRNKKSPSPKAGGSKTPSPIQSSESQEAPLESFMMGYERRAARVVAEEAMKYTGDGCPMPGCDSKGRHSAPPAICNMNVAHSDTVWVHSGHISGRNKHHRTLAGCPLYHNMSAEECKVTCPYR